MCRPELFKKQSRRVRVAWRRIKRWKSLSQRLWNKEHTEDYKVQSGRMRPPLQPIISYDRAVVYYYGELATECNHFNDKLADALVELGHINETCKATLAYREYKRDWRDNLQMRDIYERYGGKRPGDPVAP